MAMATRQRSVQVPTGVKAAGCFCCRFFLHHAYPRYREKPHDSSVYFGIGKSKIIRWRPVAEMLAARTKLGGMGDGQNEWTDIRRMGGGGKSGGKDDLVT
jgi:hypothetical protein